VPFSHGEERPEHYKWLEKIAEEECIAYTYEKAFKKSYKKGIQSAKIWDEYQLEEIPFSLPYEDPVTHTMYRALTSISLDYESIRNIGTYIIVDKNTVIICDEYGRTFLLKQTVINNTINALLNAGYTRNTYPERYISYPEKSEK